MTEGKVALPTVADKQAEQVQRQAARVVKQLRDLADRVEQEVVQQVKSAKAGSSEWSSYGWVASRVVHEVQWGVANLPLSQLVSDAAAADVYRATGE
jgi:hypothetical protein